jgi:hypothetical protein
MSDMFSIIQLQENILSASVVLRTKRTDVRSSGQIFQQRDAFNRQEIIL